MLIVIIQNCFKRHYKNVFIESVTGCSFTFHWWKYLYGLWHRTTCRHVYCESTDLCRLTAHSTDSFSLLLLSVSLSAFLLLFHSHTHKYGAIPRWSQLWLRLVLCGEAQRATEKDACEKDILLSSVFSSLRTQLILLLLVRCQACQVVAKANIYVVSDVSAVWTEKAQFSNGLFQILGCFFNAGCVVNKCQKSILE